MTSKPRQVEDPDRLHRFADATSSLSWKPADRGQSLQQLFLALGELAEAEIRYYYERRKQGRRISRWARALAWLLGSLGLLAPLVATATSPRGEGLARWGYVLLAASASCIAANTLFGGSTAHTRYVAAQLDLERLLTLFRLDWHRLRAAHLGEPSEQQLAEAFASFREFGIAFYKVLTDETDLWGATLAEAIDRYAATARSPSAGSPT